MGKIISSIFQIYLHLYDLISFIPLICLNIFVFLIFHFQYQFSMDLNSICHYAQINHHFNKFGLFSLVRNFVSAKNKTLTCMMFAILYKHKINSLEICP